MTDDFDYLEAEFRETPWRFLRSYLRHEHYETKVILRMPSTGRGTYDTPKPVDGVVILYSWGTGLDTVWRVGPGEIVARAPYHLGGLMFASCDVLKLQATLIRDSPDLIDKSRSAVDEQARIFLSGVECCLDVGTAMNIFEPEATRRVPLLRQWLEADPGLAKLLPLDYVGGSARSVHN